VLELRVRVNFGVRVRVRARDAQDTKRLGAKMLGYDMSGCRINKYIRCWEGLYHGADYS